MKTSYFPFLPEVLVGFDAALESWLPLQSVVQGRSSRWLGLVVAPQEWDLGFFVSCAYLGRQLVGVGCGYCSGSGQAKAVCPLILNALYRLVLVVWGYQHPHCWCSPKRCEAKRQPGLYRQLCRAVFGDWYS